MLIGRPGGVPNRDFVGHLSFSWPKRPDQTPLNTGMAGYDPQFAFGYGLSYAAPRRVGTLPEPVVAVEGAAPGVFLKDDTGANGFAPV